MSDISAHSKKVNPIQSTPAKRTDLNDKDLGLVAERLSLIRGHIANMPKGVVSGSVIRKGYWLVALKINGHEAGVTHLSADDLLGTWTIDGKNVDTFTQLTEKVI